MYTKLVSRGLSEEQKVDRKVIYQDLLPHVNEEPVFLDRVVTEVEEELGMAHHFLSTPPSSTTE